jgi:hypothetical protein
VRESTSARGPLPRATGIIDTLSAGFGVVNQRPWIVLLPVLLDLFFVFGPRVSVAPLVSRLVALPAFERSFAAGMSPDAARAEVIAVAEDLNLLALLSPGGVSIPSVVPLLGVARGPIVYVDSGGAVLAIGLGALLVGALLGCVYRVMLAQGARDGAISPLRLPREAILAWLRVVGFAIVLLVLMVMVVIPLAIVTTLASLIAAGAAMLMTGVVVTIALVAQLYLFFTSDAIFMSRVGPIEAMRRSVSVVHAGAWSALSFAVLVTVTLVGMTQVWTALASQAGWGLAFAIVGNAYIASGLVAASMLFYQERMTVLLAQRAVVAAREV